MRTLLVSGHTPVPPRLRELLARGSTSLVERPAAELSDGLALDADRIVFWSAGEGTEVGPIAERYARAEAAERAGRLVFVAASTAGAAAPAGLQADELFVWPRDEDRLRMAFLTGA